MEEGFSKGRRKVWLAVTSGVLIAIVLLIVILALVFKPRKPVTTIDSIKPHDMNMDLDVLGLRVNLNVTLDLDASVKNTNNFRFKYSDNTAYLNYRGQLIGEAPIPNGEISPRETKGMNLTLTLMADRFLSDSQALKDVMSGTLALNTFTRISGQVSILGFINFHVLSTSSCDFTVNLINKIVGDQECKSTTKL